jgi:hypothetical protein
MQNAIRKRVKAREARLRRDGCAPVDHRVSMTVIGVDRALIGRPR